MNAPTMGFTPASSRQEVEELIKLVGQSNQEIGKISDELEAALNAARAAAEQKIRTLHAVIAEASAKLQAWFRVHPEAATMIEGAEHFLGDPMEAQLAAVVLAASRPLTQRQVEILKGLKQGQVLRRINKHRSYALIWPGTPAIARRYVNTNHVFDLQARFLDAHDPHTGERLLGVSAFDNRAVEFRIKPGVVLPC